MKYSVVVCARNEAWNIAECLRSIDDALQRLHGDGEIVVVDDGSEDGTVAAAADSGVAHILVRSSGRGAAASRNLGIIASHGDVVVFCDADGVVDSQALVTINSRLSTLPFPDIVQGNVWAQYYRDQWCQQLAAWRRICFLARVQYQPMLLNTFHTRFVAIRRELLDKLAWGAGAFDESFPDAGAEDVECGNRAFASGATICLAPAALYFHKDPPNVVAIIGKRFQNGCADGRAAIAPKLLSWSNLVRGVLLPARGGVSVWFAVALWAAYTVGGAVGRLLPARLRTGERYTGSYREVRNAR